MLISKVLFHFIQLRISDVSSSDTLPGVSFAVYELKGLLFSQQVVKQIHTLNLLLKVCAPVYIQGKGYVLMSKDFRKRLYIKLRYLDCPHCKCMPDLMELHFLQSVPF